MERVANHVWRLAAQAAARSNASIEQLRHWLSSAVSEELHALPAAGAVTGSRDGSKAGGV